MQPALSILIPVYNFNIKPLVECLYKEISQLEVKVEIRILDDASTQSYPENDEVLGLENVHSQKLSNNVGRAAARTRLAEAAKADWLLFLDADVMPVSEEFIQNYLKEIDGNDVLFGGVTYHKEQLKPEVTLRWYYGQQREAKTVDQRKKDPYHIISQNLMIRKQTFLKANTISENLYGLDNIFSNRLQRMKARIEHIENPTIHLGLESNEVFLKKALQAIDTTVKFEKSEHLDRDARPLQKAYLRLKKWGLTAIFVPMISLSKKWMESNFLSGKPNLFWFDLYRLHYYILAKRKHA